MLRQLFTLPLLFTGMAAISQSTVTDTLNKMATVDVTVTDMKAKPKQGEQVVFRGENTGKSFSAFSDATGKIKQLLPPGDNYHVSLKSISDTTKYTILNVPALAEDEYFTEPFWVNIKFEPVKSYKLNNVHFDFDKATLRPDSYTQLTELLEYLQHHPGLKIEIAGHTDDVGGDAHNLKLSQERANTIKAYLVKKGINAALISAKGYGATLPVADNSTEKGRQLNRRTEVKFL
jgi:OmpA-OmpF porin, OOP family